MLRYVLYTLFVLIILMVSPVVAQIDYIGRPNINYVNSHHKVWDIKGVYFTGRYGVSSSYMKYKAMDLNKKWFLGIGIHATLSMLSQQQYTTAATRVIKNSTNWFAFTFPDIEEKVDTLIMNQSFILTGNLYVALQYRFNTHHEVGVHIDLAGASFGIPASAQLISSKLPGMKAEQSAMPSLFNYTLLSSNNHGSLYYALIYRYWFNDRLGVNASVNYVYTEFRTDSKILYDNSRFRNKGYCFMLGISYAPFHKKYKD